MKALVESHPVKLCLEHSISSSKMLEVKFDLEQKIQSVMENIQKRYGTDIYFMKLVLKDNKGAVLANLDDPQRTLGTPIIKIGSYGTNDGYTILVVDLNPSSIHKEIEDLGLVQKYKISDSDYDNVADNFRKWKKDFLEKNPQFKKQQAPIDHSQLDPEYMKEIADGIKLGSRAKMENGSRGVVKYVGKIMDKGMGYWIGVQLDEPFGNSSGTIKGVKYFDAPDKYAMFVRPDKLQIGDFPELDIDDQI